MRIISLETNDGSEWGKPAIDCTARVYTDGSKIKRRLPILQWNVMLGFVCEYVDLLRKGE